MELNCSSTAHETHAQHVCYGIDEAGRGCLAGPVVAAVVLFAPTTDLHKLADLNDSKKLSEQKRDALVPLIVGEAAAYGIGLSWQTEVDEVNIVNATFRAMCRAIIAMKRRFPALPEGKLLIDGNLLIRPEAWLTCSTTAPGQWHAAHFPHTFVCDSHPLNVSDEVDQHNAPEHPSRKNGKRTCDITPQPAFPFTDQEAIVGGDGKIASISAASILAKTKRDHIMRQLDKYAPEYFFAKHKGYGTKVHQQAIIRHGLSPLHRTTFVRKLLSSQQQLPLFQ